MEEQHPDMYNLVKDANDNWKLEKATNAEWTERQRTRLETELKKRLIDINNIELHMEQTTTIELVK